MTRDEYMKTTGEEQATAHRKYYAQFVSAATISTVVRMIGSYRILKSTDTHFNDIPLRQWGDVGSVLPLAKSFKSAGDYTTKAGLVCVAKEAARQWKEKQEGSDG